MVPSGQLDLLLLGMAGKILTQPLGLCTRRSVRLLGGGQLLCLLALLLAAFLQLLGCLLERAALLGQARLQFVLQAAGFVSLARYRRHLVFDPPPAVALM